MLVRYCGVVMFTIAGCSRAVLHGAAGLLAVLAFATSDAGAQIRPAARGNRPPASTTGDGAADRGGTQIKPPSPSSSQRNTPHRPQSDILDLRDRFESKFDNLATGGGSIVPGVVTCEAGCDGAPGKVVYAAIAPPPAPIDSIVKASLNNPPDVQNSSSMTAVCVAGCFNEPAWQRYGRKPAVTVAALSAPTALTVAAATVADTPSASRRIAGTERAAVAHRSRPAVRTAALGSRHRSPEVRLDAPVPRQHAKRTNAKRFVLKAKHRAIARKRAPKIIVNPSVVFPPRPLPVVVRAAEARQAPAKRPKGPISAFTTTVTFAKPQEPPVDTVSSVAIARRAMRDHAFRQKLATDSTDWLNKAKRDAAPSIRIP